MYTTTFHYTHTHIFHFESSANNYFLTEAEAAATKAAAVATRTAAQMATKAAEVAMEEEEQAAVTA